jgi:hypothetical protein
MPQFVPDTLGGGNIVFSGGTSSGSLSSIVFSNSNGVSFGLNGSTMTASAAAGGGVTPALSGSNGSFSYSTATFGNLNGLSFYTTNGSMVASHNGLTTAAASDHSHGNPTLALTNLTGTTASASNGLTLSLSAAAPVALTSWTVSDNATSGTVGRLAFTNLNGVTLSLSSGTGGLHTIVGSHNALTTAAASNHSHGNPTLNLTNLSGTTASNSAGFTLSLSAGAGGGGGGATLSRFQVAPIITGTAASSHAPASWWFNPFVIDAPLTFSNIMVLKSFSLSAAAGTSAASSGNQQRTYTHGITIFRRVDWSNSSTQLTTVTTASFGLSISMSNTSVSNTMTLSWVTNTTGGTSSFTTTSNASNFMLFMQSNRFVAIPCVTSLSAGEYFIAHRHSTTLASTGAATHSFGVSNIHIAPQSVTFKMIGISNNALISSSSPDAGIGFGIASAVTTTTTMAASVISAQTQNYWYANFVNLPMAT